ncbi:uncharacterized protein LOC120774558 [Bactrocera tryoni]|uniref:uncharacterized protein LOC120774558 n=1 Tax=Bactrocera tryoni TaxID=59916 RepID=UPI001A98C127|nr:uncharacterized protein LOC120774558 [Bactrocera tryoni]
MSRDISGIHVPVFIIGDSAFRFSKQMMKPYPFGVNKNHHEKVFNYTLLKTRRVVENAFGHLKARFRRIGKGIDNSVQNANSIIISCCALHNFLSDNNDTLNARWLRALEELETRRQNPCDVLYASDDVYIVSQCLHFTQLHMH